MCLYCIFCTKTEKYNDKCTQPDSTLSSTFPSYQCADHKVEALCNVLQSTVQQWRGRFPSPLPLELYTSSNFIGLFVEEQVADILKQFAADFAQEAARKAGRNQ